MLAENFIEILLKTYFVRYGTNVNGLVLQIHVRKTKNSSIQNKSYILEKSKRKLLNFKLNSKRRGQLRLTSCNLIDYLDAGYEPIFPGYQQEDLKGDLCYHQDTR